ncbi:Eco29kI family restriction endonuclease [Pyxidicoccus sp. 3LG]
MTHTKFSLDHLSETEFEEFCVDLLRARGLKNLDWRKGTGLDTSPSDSGRDIVCEQFTKDEIDETFIKETWFVECKHHRRGVPAEKLQNALAWAAAERPSNLLFVVSGALSNSAKSFLKTYELANKPPFRIRYWEKSDLERLTLGNEELLGKYSIAPPRALYRVSFKDLNDPLVLAGIAQTLIQNVTKSEPVPLGTITPFDGAGLYALYYRGNFPAYQGLKAPSRNAPERPVYVGKATQLHRAALAHAPPPLGAPLYRRLKEHAESIKSTANLSVDDFWCRYAVMADIWAILAQRIFEDLEKPIWNSTLPGFGLHNLGTGRVHGRRSDWDTLHPGRKWCDRLSPSPCSQQEILNRVSAAVRKPRH